MAATPELAALRPILIYRREIEDICMYRVRVREYDTTPNPLEVPPVVAHHHQIASLSYSFWMYSFYVRNNSLDFQLKIIRVFVYQSFSVSS